MRSRTTSTVWLFGLFIRLEKSHTICLYYSSTRGPYQKATRVPSTATWRSRDLAGLNSETQKGFAAVLEPLPQPPGDTYQCNLLVRPKRGRIQPYRTIRSIIIRATSIDDACIPAPMSMRFFRPNHSPIRNTLMPSYSEVWTDRCTA